MSTDPASNPSKIPARSHFAMQIENTLRRIDEVQPALNDISETLLYDEVADRLRSIANEIQATRNVMTDPDASPSPADINMANIMVSTLRSQAEYLECYHDNGRSVSTKLRDLVREVRNNPAYGILFAPTADRFPID
ncbi:hypothetical protein PENSTE_c014G04549 [Penicillium steckii]|uniref:Uncharacterized protein n=1 Tax=Penicillium steckii TaxID=303698 RepID=A0A1V6T1G8_9EURO|nr:hypothetical protein PENSTE_c014G04549 [Penicillium steckii]